MANGRTQHPNAPLTPVGRRRMVACVLDRGWTVTATAERFQVDAKTVRKWRDRFLSEGDAGLEDRSSRPHRSPNRTSRRLRRQVIHLRRKRRWGADHIGFKVGLAASTVQTILNRAGLGRLFRPSELRITGIGMLYLTNPGTGSRKGGIVDPEPGLVICGFFEMAPKPKPVARR